MNKFIVSRFVSFIMAVLFPVMVYADYPHTGPTSDGIVCTSCHTVHGPLPSWATHKPTTIDDTPDNNLCWSCHNDVRAPYQQTHSSLTTSTTYGNWTVQCKTCHAPDRQVQTRTYYSSAGYLFKGTIASLTNNTITRSTGAAWIPNEFQNTLVVIGDPTAPSSLFYKIVSNTADTLTVSGNVWAATGDTFAIVFGALVRDTIAYQKSSLSSTITGSVKFVSNVGPDSYADGTSTKAVCDVCHTLTRYHRKDGTGAAHHSGEDCIRCHTHEGGFKASCNACHAQPPSTGSHVFHASSTGRNFTCDTCHVNSAGSGVYHDNRKVSIGFNLFNGLYTTGLYDGGTSTVYESTRAGTTVTANGSMTCSNLYCHGSSLTAGTNTSPKWGDNSTAVCGSCHGASPANPPTTGAHVKHAGQSQYAFSCASCHYGFVPSAIPSGMSTHVDNVKNVAFPSGGAFSSGTCSSVYCHSNGSGSYAAISWSGSVNPDCSSCHGGNASAATVIATNAHNTHVNSPSTVGFNTGCAECHSATVSSDRVIADRTLHVNNNVNVRFDNGARNKNTDAPTYNGNPATSVTAGGSSKAAGSAPGNCANVYCHSSGNVNNAGTASAPVTFRTIAWNASPIACDGCHGDQAGKSWPVYASGAAGSQTANSHVQHVGNGGLTCDLCHVSTTVSAVTTAGAMTVVPGGAHLNRADDVSFKLNGGKTGTYVSNTKTCTATYCHGGTSQQWGGAALGCNGCHDASNTGLSGRHDIHYNSATPATNLVGGANMNTATAYVFACLNCHPTNQHATGPVTAGKQDANVGGTKIATYIAGSTSALDAKNFNYTIAGSCTTVCHTRDGVSGAPISGLTLTWTATATGSCGICHNKAGDASPAWSAPHTRHINTYSANANLTCNACHAGTAANNTTINGASGRNQHPNGNRDLAMNAFATGGTVLIAGAQGSQTCANTYCHSNGTVAAGTHAAISWTGSTTCASCHAALPATGAHARHLADTLTSGAITCNNCHNATASNNTTISNTANHVDKNVTINFNAVSSGATATYNGQTAGGASVYAKPVGTAAGTCNTTYCHGVNSQTWTTVNNDAQCVKCHGVVSSTTASYTADPRRAAPGYIVSSPSGTGVNTAGIYGTLSGFSSVSTDTRVGAHNGHVSAAGGYSASIACSLCHQNVISLATTSHMGGSTTFLWSGVSITGGLSPSYNSATAACSTTYCHGNGIPLVNRGTGTTPVWTNAAYIVNPASSLTDCQVCHLSPPPFQKDGVTAHPAATLSPPNCSGCHGHNGTGVNHINGIVESGGGSCNSCHSYDTVGGVWGSGSGNGLTGTIVAWGAHAKHIDHLKTRTGTSLNAAADTFGGAAFTAVCGVCHTVSPSNHQNTTRQINFGDGSAAHQFGSTAPIFDGSGTRSCSNLDCHFKATPAW